MMISVLTPSYNSGEFIERAIKSVLTQSYKDWEHIIVDGGSTDKTFNILSQYKHIKWVSEPDQGQSDAMNKAFDMSRGEIIMYLNADDEVAKDAFAVVVKEFQSNPYIQFLAGKILIMTSHNQSVFRPTSNKYIAISPQTGHFPVNPVGYYYRRQVQEQIGLFPLELHYLMDYWFLVNVYKDFRVFTVDFILGTFHHHDGNKTHNNYSHESSTNIINSVCSIKEIYIVNLIELARKIKQRSFLKGLSLRERYSKK